MYHIHRSSSKRLLLHNRIILLGADVVFTDSCSGDPDGFTIVVAERTEKEFGDREAVCLISKFDGLIVQTDEDDSISLSLRHLAFNSLLRVCMFLVQFR